MTANELKAIRLCLSMTQEQFANLLGVSRATIARMETGSLRVSEKIKAKIALKVDLNKVGFFSFYKKYKAI